MCRWVSLLLALALPPLALAQQERTPSQIGVVGGSLPADGVVHAQEHIPTLENLPRLQLGRPATAADIAAWDIDIRYDGAGLPPGEGSVESGTSVYDIKCASCHGDFGQGEGRWPVLAGGYGTLDEQGGSRRPEKTVGSYWPYVSTLFDYIRRAMPYNAPQSLTDEETYGLVAYLLYLNDLVEDDFVANAQTLQAFEMPNQASFFIDPRPDVRNTTCMENCRNEEELALIESIQGVTPLAHLQEEDADGGGAAMVAAAQAAPQNAAAAQHYAQFCGLCHESGVAGAPIKGDKEGWTARLQAVGSAEGLVQSSITGKGAMPPKGGAVQLSDEEIAAIVEYILQESGLAGN